MGSLFRAERPQENGARVAVFAGAAVILASVGLFGVMATMVRQRTRELGVRMALGATAENVRWMVLRRGLTIASIGLGAGLIGAVVANRMLSAMLYKVSPTDTTLVVVGALVIGVAAVATFLPARASTRIDPVIALKAEG